jgi:hypothetical protein
VTARARCARRGPCAIALAALVGLAAGCAPNATVRFSSTVTARGGAAIERILVIADIRLWQARPALYDTFRTALADRLASCGVTSRIWYIDPKATDDALHFRTDLKQFQPTVVVSIKDTEDYTDRDKRYFIGKMVHASLNTQPVQGNLWATLAVALVGAMIPYYAEIQMLFTLRMFDSRSAIVTWQARSEFNFVTGNGLVNDERSIRVLATGIVTQLRDDGVLNRCPAKTIDPETAECLAERRRTLQEAAQLQDAAARVRMIQFAPVCK